MALQQFDFLVQGGQRVGDLGCRAAGLSGERLHFPRDHGETLAGFSGARRLDRRIQRQQIGLGGNRLNLVGHICDLVDLLTQTTGFFLDLGDRIERRLKDNVGFLVNLICRILRGRRRHGRISK
jgi:hypothetical protein